MPLLRPTMPIETVLLAVAFAAGFAQLFSP